MAFLEMHYFSNSLQKATAANVILPELDHPGPFPVFYLLHGLSDDNSNWQRRTSIERYVENLPLIVVMPDGGRGWYCDAQQGYAYESAIVNDLVSFMDSRFNTIASREGRCLGGLSMGGYGAIKLALAHADMFCSTTSHSGALDWVHRLITEESDWAIEFRKILGESPVGGPNDTFALAEKICRDMLPAIRIDCGVDDFLIEENRSFHAHLDKLKIPHEYKEFPGDHNWGYWDEHVQEAIAFHSRQLGI